MRRTDLRSNSAFSFSPVSPSPSSRSLAELTSWGSPLKLSLPSFSSSGMLHHSIEIKIMLCILKDYLLHKFILLTSVGLALDYAAHIGVTYVVTKGKNRRERAQASVSRFSSISPFSSTATLDQIKLLRNLFASRHFSMGTAVAHGGVSTLLAFILVAFSNSYVYLTFFKVSR